MSQIEATYISHMGDDLTVVNAARVSFGKKKDKLDDKDVKLINYLAKNKHLTPFEHCILSVNIKCPLFIRSQIHRHRTFSYSEISRRYTDKDLGFFIPDDFRKQHKDNKQSSYGIIDDKDQKLFTIMCDAHQDAFQYYEELIASGLSREQARGVLPQNVMTEFWMTGNLRNWIHFLGLRVDVHAQKEVRDVAQPILKIIMEKFPLSAKALFEHQLNIKEIVK